MKALVVTPKNDSEFKFVSDLLDKLGINSSALSKDELEDIGMSKLMHSVDKTKKASRSEIMKKLYFIVQKNPLKLQLTNRRYY